MIQISHIFREAVRRKAFGLHRAPWSISTTEVLCSRMSSLESALACHDFFRKNLICISDEAVFLLYYRLFSAAPLQYDFLIQSGLRVLLVQSLDVKDYTNCNLQGNNKSLIPLVFLLQNTQQQTSLRPLNRRLNDVISAGNLGKPIPLVSVALSILSTPCAILNISLHGNLSKRRWNEALQTIHHCQKYDFLRLYVSCLNESRLKYFKSLRYFRNDPYYAICLTPPSLVPLMSALLIQWKAYWDSLKGVTETECLVKDGVSSLQASLLNIDDGNEFGPYPDGSLADITQRSELEGKSLDVLSFAAHIYFSKSNYLQNDVAEQEVYHRLTEATTRLADYAFCRRLVEIWSGATSVSSSLQERPPNEEFLLSETKQLLFMRLLERSPSHDAVLQDLDLCFSYLALPGSGACLSRVLYCPEVLSVLASRLKPNVFLQEVVEKRLMCYKVLLSESVQGVVRSALERGGLYDSVEKIWIRQAHLELTLLCETLENSDSRNACESVLEGYLSQIVSKQKRVSFLSTLLRGVDKQRCTSFVKLICTRSKNQDVLQLLIQVMSLWIKEYHCPGDAAVLLYLITQSKFSSLSTNLSDAIVQETTASFVNSVAQLGFYLTEQTNDSVGRAELVVQWLKMLSEVPPKLFDEPTLVVWCFWTMRSVVQWEEQHNGSTLNNESISVNFLQAVRNLCLAMENCEADAVLPPMLLNWLVSRTRMSWVEATGWIARNAGVETSEKRRFLFIRLPLGSAGLETFAAPQNEKQALLVVERELQKNAPYAFSCYTRIRCHDKKNITKEEYAHDYLKKLYNAIRLTLLRAWYNSATSPENPPDHTTPCPISALPLTCRPSGTSHRKPHSTYVLFSLQEALRTLWEEPPESSRTKHENPYSDT